MQLVDRIEKRRFIGREFLLWLWFESEVFEATLSSKEHGSFGLWIEKELVLSAGKETTRIKGSTPAHAREAKEGLSLGKLPERATLHVSLGDRDATFALKAESMAIAAMSLPTVLSDGDEAAPGELGAAPARRPRMRRTTVEEDREREADMAVEQLHERMMLAREMERLLEELYRDFLGLRLSDAWTSLVRPAIAAWAAGKKVDAERYRAGRARALSRKKK